jgi:choice-of-anchor A domain-containing protein
MKRKLDCVQLKRKRIIIGNWIRGAAVLGLSLPLLLAAPSAFAAMFSATTQLGSAAPYVVLGIGGSNSTSKSSFQFYQSGTVATGNVGVGPNTTWTHGMDATILGRLDNDPTSLPLPSITGTISGGVTMPFPNMAPIVQDAVNASAIYASLTPTATFVGLADIPGQTLVGNGGLNVIDITGNVAFKTTLTLMGGPNDVFVFQYTSALKDPLVLSGANIVLHGVSTDNVIWNLAGTGGDVTISSSANVFGTILAPFRNITVDNASVTGRVIGGGGGTLLSIHSSSQIMVPEPATWVSAGLVGLPLVLTVFLRCRSNPTKKRKIS